MEFSFNSLSSGRVSRKPRFPDRKQKPKTQKKKKRWRPTLLLFYQDKWNQQRYKFVFRPLYSNTHFTPSQFHSIDNAYCKYSFSYGPDWRPIQGVEQGISQISRKAGGSNQLIVWNFPIDIAFQSTNAHGWPRLVVSVYNLDFMGRDVVRGYACILVPPFPGRYVRYAKMFVPCSTSMMQGFLAWLSGNRPEFYHAKFISQGKDREVTRVSSSGVVKVVLNVTAMGLKKCGYSSS